MRAFWGELKVLAIFFLLAVLMRFFSFFPTVIDHDESTYLLIAKAIREGQIYMVDVVDTKPIGIFLLFGFFQMLFGEAIWIIRLLTSFWIALTAFLLCRTHFSLGGDQRASRASGLIYIFLTSIFTFYGVSPNTELFFNFFTVVAIWGLLNHPNAAGAFWAGLSLGAGFMIKYVVLFDAIAFAFFLGWITYRRKEPFWALLQTYLAIGSGFLLPFTLIASYYLWIGQGEAFWFYSFEVSRNYLIDRRLIDYVKFLLDSFLRFFPVTLWFFWGFFNRRLPNPDLKVLSGAWSVLVLLIILLPGKMFGHYFIHFMLPFSLMAGSFFDRRWELNGFWKKRPVPAIGYSLLGLLIIINLAFQKSDYFDQPDYPRQISGWLKERLQPGDSIYTGNYHQILYYLLDKDSPTPFVHRSLLWDEENVRALEINLKKHQTQLLAAFPRFVLFEGDLPPDTHFEEVLSAHYQVVKTFEEDIRIYERISVASR